MIISRTPLRISLGGGGTDLPSYYENNDGGFLIAAAITKYIYVSVHENFTDRFWLKYSSFEDIANIDDIQHPLMREALRHVGTNEYLEISSQADIPAGTGLGSSGTFAVGLLNALYASKHELVSKNDLASKACHLEIDVLGEPVGKQDQYIAAIGGLTALEFTTNGEVITRSISMNSLYRSDLEEQLMLFYTGVRRSASSELAALDSGASVKDSGIQQNLSQVKEIGYLSAETLERGDLVKFGTLLTEQWRLKFFRSPSPIHTEIDGWINEGLKAGAIGGKLVGAGGGGFLLFLADNKSQLRNRMQELGLREVKFGFDYKGSVIQ
jgi:D-glycero-alpha-D-manno-heptose-7-phosphate kinase